MQNAACADDETSILAVVCRRFEIACALCTALYDCKNVTAASSLSEVVGGLKLVFSLV